MSRPSPDRSWRGVALPTRDEAVDAAFVLALGVLAVVGFRTTYAGTGYLIVALVGLTLGIAIAHLSQVLRQPVIVLAAMTVAAFFLLGSSLALRAETAAGILPTASSTRSLATVSIHGWKQLLTTLPPVSSSGPLLAIPYILGLTGGVGGFAMARRLRSATWPLLPPLGVLSAVILLGTLEPAAELLQGAVFAVVGLGWMAVRGTRLRAPLHNGAGVRSRLATAAALIGATAVGAAMLGPSLPGGGRERVVLRSYVTPPFDINEYASPLVGYRKFTKPANNLWDQTLFTVDGLPAGRYVRIATLDAYDGSVWGASNSPAGSGQGEPPSSFQRVGSTIVTEAEGDLVSVRVTIGAAYASANDVSAWLPSVGSPTAIEFLGPNSASHADSFVFNRATRQAIVPGRLDEGDSYIVHAIAGPSELADEVGLTNEALPFGSPTLPPEAYSFTSAQATKWSAEATGTAPQVLAVAKHLVDEGAFSDGGGDQSQYLPGHSLFRLSTNFLNDQQPVGNDEQYAAAFALMSNQLGLPARVVVGAVPQDNGAVQGKDVHTWVEVHLADGTWASVPRSVFMPPTTKVPDKPQPETISEAAASVVPPPNPVRPRSALDQATQDSSASNRTTRDKRGSSWQIPAFITTTIKWVGPPTLVVGMGVGVILGLKARRRRRRRTDGSPTLRISRGWNEITDRARDLGTTLPPGRTRREQALALTAHSLDELASIADATVFGPGEPPPDAATDYWERVDEARRSMTADLPRRRRWQAALSLQSLRPPPSHVEG